MFSKIAQLNVAMIWGLPKFLLTLFPLSFDATAVQRNKSVRFAHPYLKKFDLYIFLFSCVFPILGDFFKSFSFK